MATSSSINSLFVLNTIQFKKAIKTWKWTHYSLVAVVALITIMEVYQSYQNRLLSVREINIANIEEDIQEFNTMAEQLAQLEELPDVAEQWAYAVAVSNIFNLTLTPTSNHQSTYSGPLASWSGRIAGPTGQVLAAAKRIQETVPAYLYDFDINGNRASIILSVLGSD